MSKLEKTTWWEKKGNDSADRFAKLGADSHSLGKEEPFAYQALKNLVVQATRWAGQQEAHMCDHELKDSSDLDPAAGLARVQLIV
eukprot:14919258-Heterocapsa_arctica.AAC.1